MGSNSNSNFLRKLEMLNQLIYNENKNTVIDAKIGNLNELTKVLSVKEQAQEQLLVVMKAATHTGEIKKGWTSYRDIAIKNLQTENIITNKCLSLGA